jgi:hypothetical protein
VDAKSLLRYEPIALAVSELRNDAMAAVRTFKALEGLAVASELRNSPKAAVKTSKALRGLTAASLSTRHSESPSDMVCGIVLLVLAGTSIVTVEYTVSVIHTVDTEGLSAAMNMARSCKGLGLAAAVNVGDVVVVK